jgi:tripartite-type tricarboxylate transporter receptor subunit TctC
MVRIKKGLRAFLIAATLVGSAASAQEYPTHTVRIIVTFTPGGGADVTARIFAEKLTQLWKQPVIVENRVGGGGSIGAEAVYRAAPDGYTLLLATNTHIINHVLLPKLPFDFTKSFTPIALVSASPILIAVHPSVPATNLKELTQVIKAAPGKYQYAACNMASPQHFSMEMYKHAMKLDAQNIPYRGCSPAVTDTISGQVMIVASTITAVGPFVKQGNLRPIALLSSKRSPMLPAIPTARESGIPEMKNFALDTYYGFMAPPGTPAAIQQKLERDIMAVAKTLSSSDERPRLDGAGIEPFIMNSTEMMKLVREDADRYRAAAKQANIGVE